MVGAPVWPNGVTLAAEAALTVTAEAASAAAPVSILRRSRPPPLPSGLRKVSGVVMVSSYVFVGRKFMCPQSGIKRATFSDGVPAKAANHKHWPFKRERSLRAVQT